MHIVLAYRYYNDGIVYYNLTFCTKKSLMTDLGLSDSNKSGIKKRDSLLRELSQ